MLLIEISVQFTPRARPHWDITSRVVTASCGCVWESAWVMAKTTASNVRSCVTTGKLLNVSVPWFPQGNVEVTAPASSRTSQRRCRRRAGASSQRPALAAPKTYLSFCLVAFFFLFLSFSLFRAAPAAYGRSQARDPIGAELQLLAYTTATPDPSHICDLHPS